ncbi:MAG TPA: PQQ-binding-like beta-propeller repeat protein [Candidatus Competibacteraceae bacterium]|nr:PQQ-binding-like beta-propeller repeat protein [Candidatus Competibacteraceae bacterium]
MNLPAGHPPFARRYLVGLAGTVVGVVLALDAMADDTVLVGAADAVRAFAVDNGRLLWLALPGLNPDRPAASGELVMVGSSGGLYALELASGAPRWRLASTAQVFSPLIAGDTAYAGSVDGELRAISLDDGDLRWRHRFPGWVYSPALAADTLVVGGQAKSLWGLAPDSGRVRWSLPLPQELVHQPLALDAARVLITLFDGRVRALAAADGETLWEVREPVPCQRPIPVQGLLVYACLDGRIVARGPAAGALRWAVSLPGIDPLSLVPTASGVLVRRDGELLELDARHGGIRWRAAFTGSPLGAPGVRGAEVFQPVRRLAPSGGYSATVLRWRLQPAEEVKR